MKLQCMHSPQAKQLVLQIRMSVYTHLHPPLSCRPSGSINCTDKDCSPHVDLRLDTQGNSPGRQEKAMTSASAEAEHLATCRACNLQELAFWPGKMLAGIKATVKGPSSMVAHTFAWLYPILQDNLLPSPNGLVATSQRLGDSLLSQATKQLAQLLAIQYQVRDCTARDSLLVCSPCLLKMNQWVSKPTACS